MWVVEKKRRLRSEFFKFWLFWIISSAFCTHLIVRINEFSEWSTKSKKFVSFFKISSFSNLMKIFYLIFSQSILILFSVYFIDSNNNSILRFVGWFFCFFLVQSEQKIRSVNHTVNENHDRRVSSSSQQEITETSSTILILVITTMLMVFLLFFSTNYKTETLLRDLSDHLSFVLCNVEKKDIFTKTLWYFQGKRPLSEQCYYWTKFDHPLSLVSAIFVLIIAIIAQLKQHKFKQFFWIMTKLFWFFLCVRFL